MSYEFSTRAIHAAQPNEEITGSVVPPIFQTSTFGQIEPGVHKGYCYSRTGNPTRRILEDNIASLEEGKYGLAFASGLAAVNNVLNTLQSGDHVVTCRELYGGSYRMFTKLFRKFGVEFTFVDTTKPAEVEKAITKSTKILWLETPSNPLLSVTDIAACAKIAKKHGVLTVVDNTFATPYLQQPLKFGADIVLHSTTKYLNGHSDVIGGALVCNEKEIYDSLQFFQNAVGAIPGPQDCFLVLRGIKTLGIRMDRHCANARAIAHFLLEHPKVEKVYFPGLADHPGHDVAKRQQRDFGAMVSFELKADVNAAKKFTTHTKLFTLAESLGSVKSLLCHPPTMTHASVEPDVRRRNGIHDGLIRLSIGIEDVRDLIRDLEQALDKVPVGQEVTS